jgi:hypothetical protein
VITTLDMSTQCRGAAGDNSPARLLLDGGQWMRREIGLAVVTQNIGQAHTLGHDDG